MKRAIYLLTIVGALGRGQEASAQVSQFQLGGDGGQDWGEWARVNTMVDLDTTPGAIQPFELDPEENLLRRLGPWARWRTPRDPLWRPGMPRIWRHIGTTSYASDWDQLLILDGDPTTGFAVQNFRAYYLSWEYYTLDLGATAPVERYRFMPKDGVDELSGEPYRPSYAQRNFEVTGGHESDLRSVNNETGSMHDQFEGVSTDYVPLKVLLARVVNNFDFEVEVRFPLQYLRLIRHRPLHDDFLNPYPPKQPKYGLGELELYGRGFVSEATWESHVVDLGDVANVGQVFYGISRWRRENDQYVEAPEAPVGVKIELKNGLDDTPTAYTTYDQMGRLVEASEEEFTNELKMRQWPWNPAGVGWRGPIVEDTNDWSLWSAPLEKSGDRPRLPRGRYLKVRVRLETETLWDFARVDSVVVSTGPILAERVSGEVAAAGDLHPTGNVAQMPAGVPTELVYDLVAEFTAASQSGFDAVRFLTPSKARFLELEMGDPLAPAVPDSVVEEDLGFALYLPRPIVADGGQRLRVRLETTMYDAAGEMGAGAFKRSGGSLPQRVDPGDVSAELGTNQLRVLAVATSLGKVLGDVDVQPRAVTPQGDGVNDLVQVAYSLFSVREAQVQIRVYGLDGRRVRQLYAGPQSAGAHLQLWDGRDDQARLVSPGVYLMRVEVDADEAKFARLQPVAVAY